MMEALNGLNSPICMSIDMAARYQEQKAEHIVEVFTTLSLPNIIDY